MSGKQAEEWAGVVQSYAKSRGVAYEPVGGINPRDAPAALCVGGTNRLTGQLTNGYWGASCDADERETGRMFGRSIVPTAVLAKAHMPDLASVVPPFNVESIEARPDEMVKQRMMRKVEFESIDFNKRFMTTVPKQYDPVALRELFSPGFLDWVTKIDREIDFGVQEKQIYFNWRLRERTPEELKAALKNAGELFTRVRNEMEEAGIHTYKAGPWHAGLEPFPAV